MNTLTSKLIELVEEETGIKLQKTDIQLEIEDTDLIVKLWDEELITTELEDAAQLDDEDFADDVNTYIIEEYFDLREHLVDLKLQSLNMKYVEDVKVKILPFLTQAKVDKMLIETLDFEFIDVSSADKDYGLPNVALRITDFEQVECKIPIDISGSVPVLQEKKIADEFIKTYR